MMKTTMTFHWLLAIALAYAIGPTTLTVSAQSSDQSSTESAQEGPHKIQVEIVDQDGEKVSPKSIAGQAQTTGQAQAQAVDLLQNLTVTNDNGTITIVGPDGQKHQITLDGANSITIKQSTKTVEKNGKKTTQKMGKAIVIDSEGHRHEFDFEGDLAAPGIFAIQTQRASQYMIGVNCSPVSEALQAQLNLDKGTGLIVEQVREGTPAAAAGLQRHDILMFADDSQLKEVSDLTQAIDRAGKEKSPLSLTLIRGGKETHVEVRPTERPQQEGPGAGAIPFFNGNIGHGIPLQIELKQLGPGVILDPNTLPQFPDKDQLRQQMEQQFEAIEAQVEALRAQMQAPPK